MAVALAGAGQTLLHDPQFDTLVGRLTSQPLAALESQFAHPRAQVPRVHCELAHAALALGNEQPKAHAPQFATSVVVSTSQPSPTNVLQSANAPWHW